MRILPGTPRMTRREGDVSSPGPRSEVMSDDDRRAYTPEEVARMLRLHLNSVYSLLKSGEIPGLRAGHKWLIPKRRFDAWLDGGMAE